jgi:hypothetical protein
MSIDVSRHPTSRAAEIRDNVGGWTAVEVRDKARLSVIEERDQKENLRKKMVGGRKEAMSDLGRSHGIIYFLRWLTEIDSE